MSANLSQSDLDRIAEEFSQAIRRGDEPSVDTYVEKHHDPSGQLRELLSSVAMIEGLKQDSHLADPDQNPAGIQFDQLDDYQIVREIGRGGMGIVFEAIHQSLGRRVALKVLSGNLLGETKHLARFRREARAAARLRHTNIVPVFGVGSTEDHHYYVMDLIEGMSLKESLTELTGKRRRELPTIDESLVGSNADISNSSIPSLTKPTNHSVESDLPQDTIPRSTDSPDYFRWVAGLGATICDALHYAHAQGVLHRDIKPANLLIDRKNEVWIADFGLAKLTEQQAVTMTGDVVGTPQYMPPESFDGIYDVKSEVYSVGLVLYELLALRPAIEGKNTGDTIRKATAGVSISPRKYNSRIPLDLETIVLKSVAHDSRQRYISAGELRDDLQRFLSDRPIAARRTSLLGHAVRWSRREPKVASLTFATFALLSALAVVSAFGYFRTQGLLSTAESATRSANQALKLKTDALDTADQQRSRAEKNLQVALSAFNEIMTNITDRGIETDGELLGEVTDTTAAGVTPEDAKLLQTLLGFFDELATTNSEDLLAESAIAAQHAGDIYLSLGQLRQADRAYSDAIQRYSRLSTQAPENLDFTIAQAEAMNQLAVIASLRGELARANSMFEPTKELLQKSESAFSSPEGQFQFARANRLFASIGTRSGLDTMNEDLSRGPRLRGRPLSKVMKHRITQEFEAIEEAVEVLEALISESPDEVRYRAELARVYRAKAKVASRAKRSDAAEAAVRASIDRFESLLKEDPNSEALQYELAITLLSSEAVGFNQEFRAIRANELSDQLLANSPTLPRYKALKAQSLENLAAQESQTNQLDRAANDLFAAVRIYTSLLSVSPELSLYETSSFFRGIPKKQSHFLNVQFADYNPECEMMIFLLLHGCNCSACDRNCFAFKAKNNTPSLRWCSFRLR
jgi:serine/threonine protein kinase